MCISYLLYFKIKDMYNNRGWTLELWSLTIIYINHYYYYLRKNNGTIFNFNIIRNFFVKSNFHKVCMLNTLKKNCAYVSNEHFFNDFIEASFSSTEHKLVYGWHSNKLLYSRYHLLLLLLYINIVKSFIVISLHFFSV